jgi:uncharacterized protein YccT (UPF0319 family)
MTSLTVADLIHEGRYQAAVVRMQELVRVGDPTVAVDADAIRAEFEDRRQHLRSVLPPAPFRYVGTYVSTS